MANEQPNAEILVNYPPMILGATPNVIPYTPLSPGELVEGLPLALFKPVLNQQGVLANAVNVLIDPPVRDDPGDDSISIELLLNGVSLENRPIPITDRDKRSEFTLFESLLLDGVNNRLEYKIHRPSGNPAGSLPLWLIYSAQLPGGNSVPGNDDHPYLDISLPPELGDPPVIGKDDVDKGVALTVFYPFMKAYDVITVELRRQRFTFTVQPAQVGQPVALTLTRTMFEQAGNSADFAIAYTVVDQLRNPTERRRWSTTLKADVDVDRVVLDAPILREDLTDPVDDPLTVDLDKLKGAPLFGVVIPRAPVFAAGDQVAGRFIGAPSGVDVPFTGTIETDGFQLKTCFIPIPNGNVVLNDVVRASYTLLRSGSTVGASRTTTARVIGAGSPILTPPTLVAPAISPIDVLAYPVGVVAQVAFAEDPGDQAQLKEINPPPQAMPFPPQIISGGESNFTLDAALLAARQNKDVELTWALIRGGVSVAESGPLSLRVNRIADGDTRLPTPLITAVTDGVTLDLGSFTGDTIALVNAWPGIAVGQRLWMRCEGTNSSGATVTLPIHQGLAIGHAGDQQGTVTRAFLDTLADGSSISVYVAVNFDGVANEAVAVKFPVRTYTVSANALIIDLTDMILSGYAVHANVPWTSSGLDSPNNTATRTPTRGTPPYNYTSDDASIATVNQGKVTGTGNGRTTIRVSDRNNSTASFNVLVSNVYRLVISPREMNHADGTAWAAGQGSILDFQNAGEREILLTDIYRKWPRSSEYMDNSGAGTVQVVRVPVNGQASKDSYLSARYTSNDRPAWLFHGSPLPYVVTTWVLKK